MIVRLREAQKENHARFRNATSPDRELEDDSSFALQAIDFVVECRSQDHILSLVDRFLELVAPFGIDSIAMTDIWGAEPDIEACIRFTTFEAGWVADYIRDRWDRHDPIWHAAYRTQATHFWSTTLEQVGSDRGWAAARYHEAGILDGVTVPILLPKTLRSAIFLGASRPLKLGPANVAALTLAASVMGARAAELVPSRVPEIPLSAREREVLTWTATGKSARQVALVLDLSEQTVARHLLNIRAKLRVANTVQAVARAVREGMIAC